MDMQLRLDFQAVPTRSIWRLQSLYGGRYWSQIEHKPVQVAETEVKEVDSALPWIRKKNRYGASGN